MFFFSLSVRPNRLGPLKPFHMLPAASESFPVATEAIPAASEALLSAFEAFSANSEGSWLTQMLSLAALEANPAAPVALPAVMSQLPLKPSLTKIFKGATIGVHAYKHFSL